MFLSNSNNLDVILINMMLMIIWHLTVLIICMVLPRSFFEPTKKLYVTRKWEKNGNLYIKNFKIKKWKDYLPQFVAKGGFSKTCRAEWNHLMCSMYFIVSFCINSVENAVIFSLIPIICNFPFLIIQRYNRIRLLKLEKKYTRQSHVSI